MSTKQLVTADNLGSHFKKNSRVKKYEIDVSQLVDNQSTYIKDNKIHAAGTIFLEWSRSALDIDNMLLIPSSERWMQYYNEQDEEKLRRLRNHIGVIALAIDHYDRFSTTSGYQDQRLWQMINDRLPSNNKHAELLIECTNIPFFTDDATGGLYKPKDVIYYNGLIQRNTNIRQTVYVQQLSSKSDATLARNESKFFKLERYCIGTRLHNTGSLTHADGVNDIDTPYSIIKKYNKKLVLLWSDWVFEEIDEVPSSVQPPVEYTASNGVKKVGNNFQLNTVDSSLNGIKKLDDGSIYVPTSARVLTVRNTTAMMGEVNTDKPFIGVSSIVTYTPNPAHIKPSSATQYAVNIDARVSNVKVSYYFKTGNFDGNEVTGLGHEHIKNISLMPSTIRATNNPIADTNVNSYLFANNLNSRIRDFTYSDGKVSFTVPDVYSYLPAEVQFVIELKDSVKSIGSGNTLKFTGFVVVEYTDPTEVEGLLATYKRDINFSLVGNGG